MKTIKEVLEQTDLTPAELARFIGDTVPNISRMKTGARKETKKHIEQIHFIWWLHERNLLRRYMAWREGRRKE